MLIVVAAAIAGQRDTAEQAAQSSGPVNTTAQPAQATTTTTPPPPPPRTTTPPPAPPTVKTGRGDDVVTVDRPGLKIVKFDCPRCTGNTILQTDGAESLLVNKIGKYHGQHWVDIREGSVTTTYTIKATGSWTLTVGGMDLARTLATGPVTGTGDDVVLVGHDAKSAAITNKGEGNFVVLVASLRTSTLDLAVNEIGGYSGTVPFDAPAMVQVNSEGSWTITPRT